MSDTTESASLTVCDTSISEPKMPELMACCSEYGPAQPLKSLNIDGNLNMINQNLGGFIDDDGLRTRHEHLFAFVCGEANETLSRGFNDQIYDIFKMLPSGSYL